ncbi:hypothetical protein ccrud_04710 [Corynebacterium crudilactis]|uniref:Uncharacterized protein n=1 Tax=Corynebacterium crudilactis TaxID=1652495 RepID=A0A172QSA4_9CORY|nr:hypothetical protein ccrud_04710 [Corynebacterium crudilactis]
MKIRQRALIACLAAVSLVGAPGVIATAKSQDLTQASVSSSYDLLQNPITAPIGLVVTLSSMSLHYLMWCPFAKSVGWIEPGAQQCVF